MMRSLETWILKLVGRWWQIDPVTDGYEHISPYASMYNNPIIIMDPLGDEGEDCC